MKLWFFLILIFPCVVLCQNFRDEIIVQDYLDDKTYIDTIFLGVHFSIKLRIDSTTNVYGNLDSKKRPTGKWIFFFLDDGKYEERLVGYYLKGKRHGRWINGCGAYKLYKRGKSKIRSTCPY